MTKNRYFDINNNRIALTLPIAFQITHILFFFVKLFCLIVIIIKAKYFQKFEYVNISTKHQAPRSISTENQTLLIDFFLSV